MDITRLIKNDNVLIKLNQNPATAGCRVVSWFLALGEIQWVIEFYLSTKEANHINEIVYVAIASGSAFSELNLAIDTFKNAVSDARNYEMNTT